MAGCPVRASRQLYTTSVMTVNKKLKTIFLSLSLSGRAYPAQAKTAAAAHRRTAVSKIFYKQNILGTASRADVFFTFDRMTSIH
jgi:hypothetical protein